MKKHLTKSNFILLLFAIIAVLAFLLVGKSGSDDSNTAIRLHELESSIERKNQRINDLEVEISLISDSVTALKKSNDSLTILKNKVKIKYREIYIDLPHYTNSQLDSVIRSNW